MLNYQYLPLKNSPLTLVFLHGLGGDLTAWEKETKSLNEAGYSTLAIDLPGHGLSADTNIPADYTLEAAAKDIYKVLTHEKISNYALVGHCYGGMVALMSAHLYPDHLKGLILIDTSYKANFLNLETANLDFITKTLSALSANFIPQQKTDFIRDWDLTRLAKEIKKTALASYFLTFKNTLTFDGTHILADLNCPSLIIHGQEDSVIPPEIAKQMNHRLKNSTLEFIPNANHIIVLNNPNELTKTILTFLNKVK